jgi:hypothetical protein
VSEDGLISHKGSRCKSLWFLYVGKPKKQSVFK